ncbi:MAG TPA: heparan-alpha-glucosaminide N-acetyltransferase domain-containing protein [Eubacteriales bacterium]|jgi:uncharacterized membrane protein|nr:heparan-alpha-glucosaminide N-acetyltransferase domain-containing protein [Clostridia bacterium]HRR89399.1 heparan-alpha-glucosaminide N-acetyltransferase domain-containing protein [Eubacteriales bacterium]HRU84199.1 heparan-alpha-glucosaminide N-acetyltransferase domain-containing protein [Eubacteriales bacterium]
MANESTATINFDTSPAELSVSAPRRRRIWELDFIRGLCILLMIFDHIAYIVWDIFAPAWFGSVIEETTFAAKFSRFLIDYWNSELRLVGHPIVLFLFFSLCGTSCSFSRSNLKRGFELMLVAIAISVATYLFDESLFIHYGTITFLAFCILIWEFFDRLAAFFGKAQKYVTAAISLAIAIAVTCVYFQYRNDTLENLPAAAGWLFEQAYLYDIFNSPGEFTAFIPWAAFFFFGAFVGPLLYGKKRSLLPFLDRGWQKPVSFVGRHTLLIYCVHQIIITGVLALISYYIMTPGDFVVF